MHNHRREQFFRARRPRGRAGARADAGSLHRRAGRQPEPGSAARTAWTCRVQLAGSPVTAEPSIEATFRPRNRHSGRVGPALLEASMLNAPPPASRSTSSGRETPRSRAVRGAPRFARPLCAHHRAGGDAGPRGRRPRVVERDVDGSTETVAIGAMADPMCARRARRAAARSALRRSSGSRRRLPRGASSSPSITRSPGDFVRRNSSPRTSATTSANRPPAAAAAASPSHRRTPPSGRRTGA